MIPKFLLLRLLLAAAACLAVAGTASAQGFMVRPMTIRVNPLPRQTVQLPLEINNTAIDGPRTIELRLVDLSQDDQGTWQLVEPKSGKKLSGHQSSLAWTSLSAGRVSIAPQKPAKIMVKLTPPSNARGAYFAGIVAETPMPKNPVGVTIRTRFLIPLIIEIRGRTVREHVAVNDVSMTYRADTGGAPTTTAAMSVTNSGQTFSRVRGKLTIERKDGDQWRVVTRLPIEERGIIPGVTLKVGGDLSRRLPSGAYRLRADLFVDGRRVTPMQKVIQFKGDPKATIAYDATLLLRPAMVDMKVIPGATRTTILTIENTTASPVRIRMSSRTPRGLIGVQLGKIVGEDLSAQPWTTIQPSSFTIWPKGRENVRVMSSVPSTGVSYPNYYADLVLDGTYPDGQSAGETHSTIHLDNAARKSLPDGVIEHASLAEGGSSRYIAELRFANTGNVDFKPSARVSVVSAQGGLMASKELSGEDKTLLPLGQRTFSGEIDLSKLTAGQYKLVASVAIDDGKKVTRKYGLTVKDEEFVSSDGRKLSIPSVSLSETPAGGPGSGISMQQEKPVNLKNDASVN